MKKIILTSVVAFLLLSKPALAGTGSANDIFYLVTSILSLFLIILGINYTIQFFRKNNIGTIKLIVGKFLLKCKSRLCVSHSTAEENTFPED